MRAVVIVNVLVVAGVAVGQVPPGYEFIQVTEIDAPRSRPDINNSSVVIWSRRVSNTVGVVEVFEEGIVKAIVDEPLTNARPAINDLGDFVVITAPTASGPFDVALHKVDGTVSVFEANAIDLLDINNNGQFVWAEDLSGNGAHTGITVFDGTRVSQVSANGHQNQVPRINNSGDVVYYVRNVADDSCFVELVEGGSISMLTPFRGRANSPDINDSGHVVWTQPDGETGFIRCWDDGEVIDLVAGVVGSPEVNNLGELSYLVLNKQTSTSDAAVRKKDGSTFILPNPGFGANGVEINDRGEVAIAGFDSGSTGIFMLRRIGPDGDFDHNCHRDVYDMAIFENCWTGADAGPPGGLLAGCNRADFDKDGDVDHDDFVAFNGVVTGPTSAVMGCVP